MDKPSFGRKNTLTIFFVLGGFFHFFCYLFTNEYLSLLTSIARFCMKECFAMLYPLSVEYYPTVAKTMGFGYCSGFGRLGAAFIPYLMFSVISYDKYSSLLIFSATSFISSYFSHTLPYDTCGKSTELLENFEV